MNKTIATLERYVAVNLGDKIRVLNTRTQEILWTTTPDVTVSEIQETMDELAQEDGRERAERRNTPGYATLDRCWSCERKIGRKDDFCRHCGIALNPCKYACPRCGDRDTLTRLEHERGYKCSMCADASERGGWSRYDY